MIKIDHLSKKFNDNVVLDDISLDIKKGDVVGIIGPSEPVNPPFFAA